ncbi:MAG: hypothetical protein HQ581_22670 [Planctomycetes bacterium]|nr:hypothetical protein [Planctomycetota bacterium]
MIRITKATLRQLNAATGKLDADSGDVFQGFTGRLEMSDGLYHGEVHYTAAGDNPPEDTISVQSILGLESSSELDDDIGGIADGDSHT